MTVRAAECARATGLLDEARRGSGGALVVVGEPGLGKSELLRRTASGAGDLRVLRTRGIEGESEYPFAGLHELLRPLVDGLVDLPAGQAEALRSALALAPAGSAAPPVVERFAVGTATLSLLSRAAERGPVLVLVDDAHALDGPSLDALLFAVRRLHADAVASLVATRPEGPVAGAGLPELRLAGLTPDEAADLLRDRGAGRLAPEVVDQLVGATQGNPLAVLELVSRLTPEQLAGDTPLPDLLPVRLSAASLYAERVEALDAGARASLLLLALDRRSDLATACAAATLLGVDDAAVERAEDSGLVDLDLGRAVFRHPLARNAAVATASASQRRAAHRALATVLEGRGDLTWAWHRAAASILPDEVTAAALEALAASAAERSAHTTSAHALTSAARLTADPGERARRLVAAAEACRRGGRPGQVERLLDEALDSAPGPSLRAAAQRLRGRSALYHGRTGTAARLLRRAADTLAPVDPVGAVPVLGEAAFAAFVSGDVEGALRLAAAARDLLPPGAPPEPIVELTAGAAAHHLGDVRGGIAALTAAAESARERAAEPEYVAFAALALGWAGDLEGARTLLEPRLEAARQSGAYGVLPCLLYAWAALHARAGHLVVGYAAAAEALRAARDTGSRLWEYLALGCLAWVEAARGDEAACRSHADAAVALAAELEVVYPSVVAHALGLLELAQGRPDAAIAHLEPVNLPGAARSGSPVFGRPSAPDLVEAYARAGRPVPDTLTEPLLALSGDERHPLAAALAWRCRGLLDPAHAEECYTQAVRLHDQVPDPFARARTLLCLGEHLRRRERRAEAREPLRAAAEEFRRLGATPWAARADAELRAAGEAGARAGAAGSLAALTAQELQVALAVAAGATNREAAAKLFLSPKTIEFHLGQVYRRLGLRSRTELAALVQREVGLRVETRPAAGAGASAARVGGMR